MVIYVEDDKNLRELTIYALKQAGIDALGCTDDIAFRKACLQRIPDAILLDVMLPDVDGVSILRRIRRDPQLRNVPVMMLTAKDTELDTVEALDAGADDYLSKPFGMMEMVSRTRALLRRVGRGVSHEITKIVFGRLALSPEARRCKLDGELVDLTQREFDLLCYLMQHPDVAATRDTLLREVWGWDYDGGTRTVDVHIQQLRAKLGSAACAIETVRGIGYCLRPALLEESHA